MLSLITWLLRKSKLLTFFSPLRPRSRGTGQSAGRRRWWSPAASLSFSTAVVNIGFAGKLQFWLNVHFLEKCLLSTGILTFWWRPKRVWPKHLGVLSLFLDDREDKTFKKFHIQIPGGMDLFHFPLEFSQNPSLFSNKFQCLMRMYNLAIQSTSKVSRQVTKLGWDCW